MRSVGRIIGITLLSVAWAIVLGAGTQAEVGVVVHANGAASSYVERTIVDDPDPISSAWVPHHPMGGARIQLNRDGAANGDGDPSLINALAPGFPVAAWARNSPGGYDIVVAAFDGIGWTTPQAAAQEAANELDPALVLDPVDNSIHLVYWVDAPAPHILYRHAPSDLSVWSDPVQVSHPGEIACRPSGTFHDGALHVAYEVHDLGYGTTPRQVALAVHDGQAFTSQLLVTTHHGEENWPQVHSGNGRIWIDWIDTGDEMTWIQKDPGQPWLPTQVEPFQTPEDREFHVRGRIRRRASQ